MIPIRLYQIGDFETVEGKHGLRPGEIVPQGSNLRFYDSLETYLEIGRS